MRAVALACVLFGATSAWAGVTQQQAIASAKQFLKKAGLPAPGVAPMASRVAWGEDARAWSITFPKQYALALTENGNVLNFQNLTRVRKDGEKAPHSHFATSGAAKTFVEGMARRLGLPKTAVLQSFQFGTRYGDVLASWTEKPQGFGFVAGGGNGYLLVVDMADGALKSFTGDWRIKVAKAEIGLTKNEAEAAAQAAYARSGRRDFINPAKTKLGWIVGSSYQEGGKPLAHNIARLGYVVFFGFNSLYVDAKTGKVVGGQAFR